MTLNTSLIDKESRRLYQRYIKDPRIPDDLCSEIYLEFMKCMEKERAKGQKHISGGFIGQLVKLATRTVIHKSKKENSRDKILTGIVEKNASRLWCTDKNSEEREFFDRIARFLGDWSAGKANYPAYLRIFMLYHAFHLSPEFIDELAPFTGKDPKDLSREMEEVKESIRRRVNCQLEKKMTSLGVQYYHIIKKQTDLGPLQIRQYEGSEVEYRKAVGKRDQALKAIRDLKFVPTWVQIEEISGSSQKKVRYAYQTVTRAIRESFRDDTYWGD